MVLQSDCERCLGEGVIAVSGSYPNDVDYEPCDCVPDELAARKA